MKLVGKELRSKICWRSMGYKNGSGYRMSATIAIQCHSIVLCQNMGFQMMPFNLSPMLQMHC